MNNAPASEIDDAVEIERLVSEIREIARQITARTKQVVKLAHEYSKKWQSS